MNKKAKPRSVGKTLKRLSKYMNQYKILLIIGAILTGLGAFGSIFGNYMIKPIINSLVAGEGAKQLLSYVLLTVIVYIISVISDYISLRIFIYTAAKTSAKIRSDVFNHIQSLPISFFDKRQHGDLMSAMTNDIDNIDSALAQSLSSIVRGVLMFVGIITMMFVLSPFLTVVNIVLLGLIYSALRIIAKLSAKAFRSRQASLADLNGFIEEYMSGQKVIKVYNHEEETVEKIGRASCRERV